MDCLPEELIVDILDYLDSKDVISAQRITPRLLKLARDNTLWRYKCFEKAPSAANAANHPNALAALTGALGGLSLSESGPENGDTSDQGQQEGRSRISKRAQAVQDWDCTDADEKIDWYSEFIARNAPLFTQWLDHGKGRCPEVRGVAAFSDSTKAVGPLDDGSLRVWDMSEIGPGRRRFRELGKTAPGALFDDRSALQGPSDATSSVGFSDVNECIHLDSSRRRAYVAVDKTLNEVDLDTLQIISQHKYAWPITALSQACHIDLPVSVGTTWSLNLYDPRAAMRDRSRSPEDLLRTTPADPEDSIAFLPNYAKPPGPGLGLKYPGPSPPRLQVSIQSNGPTSTPRQPRQRHISDYARIEPGPLSILHEGPNNILIAGRFPSILSYDRRFFPRLQNVIHSGARLSSLASLPHRPRGAGTNSGAEATLIACGEYGGRGSLELYSLPHVRQDPRRRSEDYGLSVSARDLGAADREHAISQAFSESDYPFSYKNRQEASSAKLLSVAAQGTRIVFSDAEGGLKWVERDGRGLARRWNVNSLEINELGASVQGEQVVRKIVPLSNPASERGARGDGDLLIWTGERIGIVTTKISVAEDELAQAFDERLTLDGEEEQAEAYARRMRRALERQADEINWMRRFGIR